MTNAVPGGALPAFDTTLFILNAVIVALAGAILVVVAKGRIGGSYELWYAKQSQVQKQEVVVNNTMETNKTAATRFIDAFNTDDWDTVREVVAPNYVLTHPVPGTVQLGPEGMIAVWSHF